MNTNDKYIKIVDDLLDLRSGLLDEMKQLTSTKSTEYLLLEREFDTIGKIVEQMTRREEIANVH